MHVMALCLTIMVQLWSLQFCIAAEPEETQAQHTVANDIVVKHTAAPKWLAELA